MDIVEKYRMMDETSLVEASVGGDGRAFSELMERSEPKLRSVLGRYSLGDSLGDVLQESYRKAFQSLGSFDVSRAAFITWISTIASRTAMDFLRSRTVHEASPLLTNDSGELLQPQAMVDSPEDTLIFSQSYQEMVEKIHNLPESYRIISELRFLDELPYEEIAFKLSLPLNTVRTRIRRAKAMLTRG